MPSSSRCLNATRASLGLWSKSAPRSRIRATMSSDRGKSSGASMAPSSSTRRTCLPARTSSSRISPSPVPLRSVSETPARLVPRVFEVLFAQDRFHAVEEVAPIAQGVDAVGDSNEPPPENANRFLVGSTRF